MIYFDCLEVLGLTQTCDFWGSNINFRNVQNYTARGRVSGDPNSELIAPAWSNMSGLMSYSSGYMPIYAQGVLLGTGKITQLGFEGGTDVRNKLFTLDFQILKSGDLSNVTGSLYSGLDSGFQFFPYLNSLTESYQYSQNNNLTTEISRNLNFELEKTYTSQLSGAHLLGTYILGTLANLGIYSPPVPPQFSGIEGVVRGLSQSLDTINGSFSFSENISYQSGRAYVHEYQHSLDYNEGIATVTEQGTVQSTRRVSGTGSRMDFTISGWNETITGIFPRVSGVFSRWQDQFQNSGCPLSAEPYTRGLTKDYSRGLLSYDFIYNNDPSYKSGIFHSYEQTLSLNDLGWIEVGVNGNIRAKTTGNITGLTTFYRNQVAPNITGYARTAYTGSVNFFKSPYCSGGYTGNLSPLNSEESYTDLPATIDYDFNFTDDPSYTTGIFRRIKNTISNQEVVPIVNIFRMVNDKELPQNSFQSRLGLLTNNIEIIGTTGASLAQYKSAASGRLVVPTGNYWMVENSYNFSPSVNKFSMSVGYNYEGYRAINDFNI